MNSRSERDKTKQIQDKCQTILNGLLRDEDNKYCVDCDSKGPRWASWNLGVFLCIRCAGIHRNLGVHISKVKSVNLDSWTPEQVVSLQQMGNSRARAVYEANLPDNFRRPQSDSSLESFIRAKYEHKKYIAREWVPPPMPKVNWEKDIEEELEKQKRRKGNSLEKKTLNSVEVPQLPKPKSASPKPGRISLNSSNSDKKESTDLLGLQNGEETFSGFLSAPVAEEKQQKSDSQKKEEADPLKSEEESFFNQTAPTEKEKIKLTKDSILALYGNAPPVNNFNASYQNQILYQQTQPPQPFIGQQSFNYPNNVFPQQNPQAVNGMPQFNQFQQFPPQQFPQYGTNNQFSIPQYNSTLNQYPSSQMPQLHPNNTFQPIPSSQFQQQPQNTSFVGQNTSANPFFTSQTNVLPQQFANLSLSKAPTNPTPTVATNLWQ